MGRLKKGRNVAAGPPHVPAHRAGDLVPPTDGERLDRLKGSLAAKLYEAMIEPHAIVAFQQLLLSKSERVRTDAWALALKHGWPVPKDVGDGAGPTRIIIQSMIPRPEKDVTPAATTVEITSTPSS